MKESNSRLPFWRGICYHYTNPANKLKVHKVRKVYKDFRLYGLYNFINFQLSDLFRFFVQG